MNPSRQFASLILLLLMVGAGIAALLALAGRSGTSIAVCGGALVVCVVVLILGGLIVGTTGEEE